MRKIFRILESQVLKIPRKTLFFKPTRLTIYVQIYMKPNLCIYFYYFSEIGKVRGNLFQINGKKQEPLSLPEAAGAPVTLSEKVYVPIKEYPDVSIYYL